MSNNEDLKNAEGYTDFTAYAAIKAVHGAETKAYHCYRTFQSVARLAGFKIIGDVRLQDGTGTIHSGRELMERRKNDVEGVQSLWKDPPAGQ